MEREVTRRSYAGALLASFAPAMSALSGTRRTERRRRGSAAAPPTRSRFYFVFAKMPGPLVCVAIAVWSQLELLLVLASQPDEFGPLESNWSSL